MKIIHHVIFWICISILLIIIFGKELQSFITSFYFISMLLPVIISTSYFFNFVLVPKYLLKKRYMQFVLYMLYTLIVSMYMEMIVITLSFIILANYQYSNLSPIIYDVFVMAVLLYFVVFLNAFILMIIRSHKRQGELNWLKEQKGKFEIGHLIVRSERRNRKIDFDDIRYLESLADYVRIFVSDQKNIITKEKISSFEGRLPDNFLRVHRSFIVNKNKIESFSKEEVRIDGQDIPISRTYKNKTLNELSKNENAGELSGH